MLRGNLRTSSSSSASGPSSSSGSNDRAIAPYYQGHFRIAPNINTKTKTETDHSSSSSFNSNNGIFSNSNSNNVNNVSNNFNFNSFNNNNQKTFPHPRPPGRPPKLGPANAAHNRAVLGPYLQFICRYSGCGNRYPHIHNLREHDRMHSRIKPFACRLCQHRSSYQGAMMKHLRRRHFPTMTVEDGRTFIGKLSCHVEVDEEALDIEAVEMDQWVASEECRRLIEESDVVEMMGAGGLPGNSARVYAQLQQQQKQLQQMQNLQQKKNQQQQQQNQQQQPKQQYQQQHQLQAQQQLQQKQQLQQLRQQQQFQRLQQQQRQLQRNLLQAPPSSSAKRPLDGSELAPANRGGGGGVVPNFPKSSAGLAQQPPLKKARMSSVGQNVQQYLQRKLPQLQVQSQPSKYGSAAGGAGSSTSTNFRRVPHPNSTLVGATLQQQQGNRNSAAAAAFAVAAAAVAQTTRTAAAAAAALASNRKSISGGSRVGGGGGAEVVKSGVSAAAAAPATHQRRSQSPLKRTSILTSAAPSATVTNDDDQEEEEEEGDQPFTTADLDHQTTVPVKIEEKNVNDDDSQRTADDEEEEGGDGSGDQDHQDLQQKNTESSTEATETEDIEADTPPPSSTSSVKGKEGKVPLKTSNTSSTTTTATTTSRTTRASTSTSASTSTASAAENETENSSTNFSHHQQLDTSAKSIDARSLVCRHCGRANFASFRDYCYHDRTHSGLKPYSCTFNGCGMTFAQRCAVKAHLLKRHKSQRKKGVTGAVDPSLPFPESFILEQTMLVEAERVRLAGAVMAAKD
ncbi:hypothetical protein TYRP_015093 [Tyrophagus putrescentiae]|nr:hypothetical protein TYRP_015093 [Tyrophagus putrescentiae]